MATPADAFCDVHALAAMAPPPLAALLSVALRLVCHAGGRARAETELRATELETEFARELLNDYITQAMDALAGPPEDSIFDRLLVANTTNKLGGAAPDPTEPAPEPEPGRGCSPKTAPAAWPRWRRIRWLHERPAETCS